MFRNLPKMAALLCAWALCMPAAMPATAAEKYPVKPIRIIVPSSPSSGPDIIARLTGAVLIEAWGQQLVVDNRAGASRQHRRRTRRACRARRLHAAAATSQQVIGPLYIRQGRLPPAQGFHADQPVSPRRRSSWSVHPSVPATSVQATCVALAKGKPGDAAVRLRRLRVRRRIWPPSIQIDDRRPISCTCRTNR